MYLYTLCTPETGEVRYVGITTDLKKRFQQHLAFAEKGNTRYVYNWIRSLKCNPVMNVIATTSTYSELQKLEIETIKHMREEGVRLTNLTEGGDGTIGYIPTPEQSEKRKSSAKAATRSPEYRAKISESSKQMWKDPLVREKIRTAIKLKNDDPEYKQKFSEIQKKRCNEPKYKELVSQNSKKMWEDPEYRLKMSKKRKCYTPIVGPDGFIYPSMGIAAQILGIPRPTLSKAIKINKPYKGMNFSYLK